MNKDGGPAYPNITPDMPVDGGPGMTLRQYYKGQAIAGLCVNGGSVHDIVEMAMRVAAAALAEDAEHESRGETK